MARDRSSRLPDTPWHVGYTFKDEQDPKRHKAWCIHIRDKICTCGSCGCYMARCAGSSHCKFYAVSEKQWEDYLEEMKTEDDKAYENALKAREIKQKTVKSILCGGRYTKSYRFFPMMMECPFCGNKLRNRSCSYCHAKFKLVDKITDKLARQEAKCGFFLIERVKKE